MANNYNGVPRPPVVFCARRRGARRRAPRDLRGPRCPRRLGSACSATARSAPRSRSCCAERADAIAARHRAAAGARPACSPARAATSTRSSRGSDLIVELIGGIEPARDYVLRAMRAGKHVVTANKQLLSQHGEELWACAREHGVQLRFEAAVAGVVPVIRVLQESLAARARRAHPRDRQRHDQLHPHRDGARRDVLRARRSRRRRSSATPRPTRPTTSAGRDAAAKMAILARLAFDTPGPPRPGPLRGHRAHHARRHRLRAAARPRAEADRDRRARRRRPQRARASRRSSTAAIRSRRSTARSTRSRSSPTRSPRSRCPGPGAGGPQTASAVLGDVISAMIPPASTPETTAARCAIVNDVESAFYLHLEVADRPGVLAAGRRAARHAGRVDQVGRAARASATTRGS